MWYYDHADVDGIYKSGLTDAALHDETPPGMFLTVTTLKDPSKMHGSHHTCGSFAFVRYEAFEKWAHTKYGSRPADYDAMNLSADSHQRLLNFSAKTFLSKCKRKRRQEQFWSHPE